MKPRVILNNSGYAWQTQTSRTVHTKSNVSRASWGDWRSYWLFSGIKPLEYYSTMQQLSKVEVQSHLCYMSHSGFAHGSKTELITPFEYNVLDPNSLKITLTELPGTVKISAKTSCFFDATTGLKIFITYHQKKKEIILAFGDSGSLTPELDIEAPGFWQRWAICTNLFRGQPDLYQQADAVGKRIIDTLKSQRWSKDYCYTLVGQSLGGSLAQYVGLRNSIHTLCYNSVALGPGLQNLIGKVKLDQACQYIKHVSVDWDYASDFIGSRWVSPVINLLAVTPGNFGQRYSIPSAYPLHCLHMIHAFHLGSGMKHIGLNERIMPGHIKKLNEEYLNSLSCINRYFFKASSEYKTVNQMLPMPDQLDAAYFQYVVRIQKRNLLILKICVLLFLVTTSLRYFFPDNFRVLLHFIYEQWKNLLQFSKFQ